MPAECGASPWERGDSVPEGCAGHDLVLLASARPACIAWSPHPRSWSASFPSTRNGLTRKDASCSCTTRPPNPSPSSERTGCLKLFAATCIVYWVMVSLTVHRRKVSAYFRGPTSPCIIYIAATFQEKLCQCWSPPGTSSPPHCFLFSQFCLCFRTFASRCQN